MEWKKEKVLLLLMLLLFVLLPTPSIFVADNDKLYKFVHFIQLINFFQ